jgi:hypothetical protein
MAVRVLLAKRRKHSNTSAMNGTIKLTKLRGVLGKESSRVPYRAIIRGSLRWKYFDEVRRQGSYKFPESVEKILL